MSVGQHDCWLSLRSTRRRVVQAGAAAVLAPPVLDSAVQTRSRAELAEVKLPNGLGPDAPGQKTRYVCSPAAWLRPGTNERIRAAARASEAILLIVSKPAWKKRQHLGGLLGGIVLR